MFVEWSASLPPSPATQNNIRHVQLHNAHKTYNDMEPELESFLVLVFRPADRAVWSQAVYKASRTLFCHRTVKSQTSQQGKVHCRGDRQSNCHIKYELDSVRNSIQSQVRPTGTEENEERHEYTLWEHVHGQNNARVVHKHADRRQYLIPLLFVTTASCGIQSTVLYPSRTDYLKAAEF